MGKFRPARRHRWSASSGLAAIALVVVTAMIAVLVPGATASAQPDGGALGAQWNATAASPPQYPGQIHIDWDVPITMSDGTVLKANVYRPSDANGQIVTTPTPTIVNMTPYTKLISMITTSIVSVPGLNDVLSNVFRGFDFHAFGLGGLSDLFHIVPGGLLSSFTVDPKLIQSGYTQVVVDVRGTGFSQGTWGLFSQREKLDTTEVINWAAHQPWSNGKIGMTGVSYSGINQIFAAEMQPPALKAIFPVEPGSDLTRDILATGGALGIGFIPLWLFLVNTVKWVPDLQALFTGRFDMKWLADRVSDPMTFMNVILDALVTQRVQDVSPQLSEVLHDNSVLRQSWRGNPSRVRIPTFIVGGWHDIFAYSEPRIYNAIQVPPGQKQLVMGDTYHLTGSADYSGPNQPPSLGVLQRAWFDHWLKGINNGIEKYGPTTLLQQGGGWISSPSFPQPGMTYRRMYLNAAPSGTAPGSLYDGSLTTGPSAPAELTVGPGIASICSRDDAVISIGITAIVDGCTLDSRVHEMNGLTFTSAPVNAPTVISGPVNVHLNTALDAIDGYWTATLNDVAPNGQSTVLTSGQLVASLRAVDNSRASRSANGDYTDPYPFLSLDHRQTLVPGQSTQLDVGLVATDAVLQPGHRLRVDVFASNAPRGLPVTAVLMDSGLKPQHLRLDPAAPSFVNVPVRGPLG